MKIEVVTLFPRMIAGTLEFGVVGRAIARLGKFCRAGGYDLVNGAKKSVPAQ